MTLELAPDPVWVIDDTGFPKRGTYSVGVARQYSGTLGKIDNCQVAVSLHQVSDTGHAILGWRLYLPEDWAADCVRRQAAGIPEAVGFQPKWQLGLDLLDQARGWGLADRLVMPMPPTATRPSFATGWKRVAWPTSWASPPPWASGPGRPR